MKRSVKPPEATWVLRKRAGSDGPYRCFNSPLRLLTQRTEHEVVERRHAVRLGPHADRTRAGDVSVVEVDHELAVELNQDALAAELHPQQMPGICPHRRIHVPDRAAHVEAALREGVAVSQDLFALMDATVKPKPLDNPVTGRMNWSTAAHIMGTTIMGDDPATSVVNRWGRAHDVPKRGGAINFDLLD